MSLRFYVCVLWMLLWIPQKSEQLLCLANSCDDGNPCTKDDCTLLPLSLLCTHTNVAAGTLCSDGQFCNGLETCNGAGACVAGTAPCLASAANPCNNTCNESTQNCYSPINTPCSDGKFCTANDKCNGQGQCSSGTASPCDGGAACNRHCNEAAQNCYSNTSITCDDGIFCNGADHCNGIGGCGIHSGNPCVNTGDCITTTCTEQNKCYKPVNTPCSPDLGDPYNCTTDVCNGNGTCVHNPVTTCDDGNICTSNTTCRATGGGNYTCGGNYVCACMFAADCNDHNPCTADNCTDGTCVHSPVTNGISCDDYDWCNGLDYCVEGTCTPSLVSPCDLTNPCNNTCNATTKTCESPVDTPCSDGQWCTVDDTCNGYGVCVSGILSPCSGNPPCNNTCNESLQTCFTPIDTNCNNTIFCDGSETCDGAGECISSGNPCFDRQQCKRACDEQTQQCVWNANGVFCVGDRCQGDWFCINGECTATLVSPCNATQCCNSDPAMPVCYANSTCPIFNTTGEVSTSPDDGFPMWYYYAAVAGALVLLCCIVSIIVLLILRRRKHQRQKQIFKSESTQGFINRAYSPSSREDEIAMGTIGAFYASTGEFAISRKSIRFVEECRLEDVVMGSMVGSGNFGKVYQGAWTPPDAPPKEVALKTLKDREFFEDFISEAAILKEFDHVNVVKFYGVYLHDGTNYIVTEFMNRGSLQDLLQTINLDPEALKEMALGAAKGMEYLHSKNIIHRDLACRNLLVSYEAGHYIVKVSDFGMSRASQSYYYSESNRIPIKWSPPEVLRHKKYTPQSDVWSYGVTLWEMYSGGVEPYTAMSNSETVEAVISGYRLPAPNECPFSFYKIMMLCWAEDFHQRPSFTQLVELVTNSGASAPSLYENVDAQPLPDEDDAPPSYPGGKIHEDDNAVLYNQ